MQFAGVSRKFACHFFGFVVVRGEEWWGMEDVGSWGHVRGSLVVSVEPYGFLQCAGLRNGFGISRRLRIRNGIR